MDVTCERCGTEYEFDETLVSDRGTTVKCTSCGHLFKVFRPGAGPAGQDRNWSIQKRDGTKLVIGSLRELQKLITQGELTEQDEISRSGEGWKLLGSIAELQTFFAAARAVKQSAPPPRRDGTLPFETGPAAAPTPFGKTPSARPGSARPPGPPAAPSRGSQAGPLPQPPAAGPPPRSPKGTIMGVGTSAQSTPPPSRGAKGTIMGVGSQPPPAAATTPDVSVPPPATYDDEARTVENVPAAATVDQRPRNIAPTREASVQPPRPPPPARAVPTQSGPGPESPPAPKPASARPPIARPAPSARPAPRGPSARSDRPARPLYMDEADHDVRPAKKSRAGLWIALVVLLAAGVGIGVGWSRIAPALGLGEEPDPVADFLERGNTEMAADHPEAYERAIRELIRGTAIRERDPRLLASLSRAHGLLAQSLAFQASDLEARAAADPALAGEAAALRREQQGNAEEARRLGEDAVRQNPNDIVAVLALADALRMTGDPSGARSHLERAATLERDPSAEQLRVAALLDAENAGNVSAAREKAGSSVEIDPAVIRSRLLYARALLADGDVAQARGQIDAVLNDHPDHPDARRLHDAIEQGLPPAAPVVAVLDGGPDVDAGVPTEEPAPVAQAAGGAAAAGGGGGGGGGGVPAGRDYDWYVGRGETAQNVGDVGRARQFFEAALALRPNGPEALTGIGYILRDQGNVAGALPKFQSAATAGYAPALIGLGLSQRDLGRKADALRTFQQYVDRGGGSERSIAMRQIEQLERELGTGGGSGEGGSATEGTGGGSGETGTGGTTEPGGTEPAPPTPPGTLPAPQGTDPANPPPSSDPPAIGTE